MTVETPAGEVSGAQVSAVSWGKHWIRCDGMGWSHDHTGEAEVVEVRPGRFLFALLKGAGTTAWMRQVAAALIVGRKRRVIDGGLSGKVQGKRGRAAGVDHAAGGSVTDAGDVWRQSGPGQCEAGHPGTPCQRWG